MRFALIDNQRTEAQPKLRGQCPGCLQPVTAKCGTFKIWHWAHLTKKACDSWWEPETEWHRTWKDKFPREWQECIQYDQHSGEKHIADVRTPHNLVIEFQHSHLDPQERIAREQFYRNMVWIVDGTRLKRDYQRFLKGTDYLRQIAKGYFLLASPEQCFPSNWLDSSVPVIFDFRGIHPVDPSEALIRNGLWCLIPGRAEGNAVVVGMSREDFVKVAPSRSILFDTNQIIRAASLLLQQQHAHERANQLQRYYQRLGRKPNNPTPFGNKRRNRRF